MRRTILLLLLCAVLTLAAGCHDPGETKDAGAAALPEAGDAELSELTAEEKIERARELIDAPIDDLYQAIGKPGSSAYASSCLGEGDDGELYYDGFTVYTYRDTDGSESVYDVMPASGPES